MRDTDRIVLQDEVSCIGGGGGAYPNGFYRETHNIFYNPILAT